LQIARFYLHLVELKLFYGKDKKCFPKLFYLHLVELKRRGYSYYYFS